MNFILTPFGSGGDVYPFIWIGKLLRERGHFVSLISPGAFQEVAEKAGLHFVPVVTEEEYQRIISDPNVWHPTKGPALLLGSAGRGVKLYFDAIRSLNPDPDTILIGSTMSFGSRLAREKLGLRLVTVHLQPSTFLGALDMPVLVPQMEWITRLPLFLRKLFYRLPSPLDWHLMPYIQEECEREGVPVPRRFLEEWWHSPDGVIGLFPSWFAALQEDRPQNSRLFDFPLYDLKDQWEASPELESFLQAGDKPVLFTAGTAMKHGHHFFETAVEACRRAGLRALLVTKYQEHLPGRIPETMLHCAYLPFSHVLPHCSALVSHGGIGTIAQALAAGVPQLLMPMAHDQPDNLNRLRRLGVGDGLYPGKFTPDRVAAALTHLIEDSKTQEACTLYRKKFRNTDHESALVEYLEGM